MARPAAPVKEHIKVYNKVHIFNQWKFWGPKKFSDFRCGVDLPLMFPAGSERNKEWGTERGFPTPTSMRNVDASCEAYVLQNQYVSEDD